MTKKLQFGRYVSSTEGSHKQEGFINQGFSLNVSHTSLLIFVTKATGQIYMAKDVNSKGAKYYTLFLCCLSRKTPASLRSSGIMRYSCGPCRSMATKSDSKAVCFSLEPRLSHTSGPHISVPVLALVLLQA